MTRPPPATDCMVPGCDHSAQPGEPCPEHQAAAAELFAWAWPNGLPKTISREEADRRRRELYAAVGKVRVVKRGLVPE